MERYFNTTGACDPRDSYMVDIQERLKEIKKLVDAGKYFMINRARQYGKTTTLLALAEFLKEEYVVISLDFQKIGSAKFADEYTFSVAFANYLLRTVNSRRNPLEGLDSCVLAELETASKGNAGFALDDLFSYFSDLCDTADKPVVLMIDEVDSAANNQVFVDFLAQIRAYYIGRKQVSTFQSVILAGVYDVKNFKQKIRPDEEHGRNSPWNIAADFDVVMSFSEKDIIGMLEDYETDHQSGMDIREIAGLIFTYTSGYPFLVSRLCKLIDEKVAGSVEFPDQTSAWTKEGFLEAVRLLLMEKNPLFESMVGKLLHDPKLKQKLCEILFGGKRLIYNPDDPSIDVAIMFGFVKNVSGTVNIANRLFEMRLYNYFLTVMEAQENAIFAVTSDNKNQFIKEGYLNMEMVLQKFVEHFNSIYGGNAVEFDEEEGRRRFLLYLRPIINGTGNYYIEAQTRDARRMDVVVDYHARQYIVELKIWRGNAYNERGEEQLLDYLDYFHIKKGYLLSYNFNKKKKIGVREIQIGDWVIVEAVV